MSPRRCATPEPTACHPNSKRSSPAWPEYDYYKHVHTDRAQAGYVPDDIIDRLCIVGSIGRCSERVAELRDAGVTHLNFYAQTENYDEHMKLYADHVLPAFRASAGARTR